MTTAERTTYRDLSSRLNKADHWRDVGAEDLIDQYFIPMLGTVDRPANLAFKVEEVTKKWIEEDWIRKDKLYNAFISHQPHAVSPRKLFDEGKVEEFSQDLDVTIAMAMAFSVKDLMGFLQDVRTYPKFSLEDKDTIAKRRTASALRQKMWQAKEAGGDLVEEFETKVLNFRGKYYKLLERLSAAEKNQAIRMDLADIAFMITPEGEEKYIPAEFLQLGRYSDDPQTRERAKKSGD